MVTMTTSKGELVLGDTLKNRYDLCDRKLQDGAFDAESCHSACRRHAELVSLHEQRWVFLGAAALIGVAIGGVVGFIGGKAT